MKLFLRISYLGTAYCGYQVQPNGISIQQRLNEATKAVFGCDCDIVGCSRTDSGVHANDFCASVAQKGCESLQTSIPIERIPLALCAHLPEDIAVLGFDDIPQAPYMVPPLASVDSRLKELCKLTAATVTDLINGKEVPTHQIIPATLQLRESLKIK